MPSDKKKSNTKKGEKGSVGVFYQGLLKSKGSLLFWSESKEPEDEFNQAKKYYGAYTRARYVVCEDPETVFNKVAKSFDKVNEFENLYLSNNSSLIEKIKEESGVKTGKTMGEAKPKGGNASDDEKENASGDDASGDESEDDEKPQKIQKNSKSDKKKDDKKEDKKEDKKSDKKNKKDDKKADKSGKKSDKKNKDDSSDEKDDEDNDSNAGSDADSNAGSESESEDEKPAKNSKAKNSKSNKKDDDKKKKVRN